MKITFTIAPKSTSFPILIINGRQGAASTKVPGQQIYTINYTLSPADRKKGSLDISGILRGPANAAVGLRIDVFLSGPNKLPVSRSLSGQYSNLSNMIFMANVPLPKNPGGFQGGGM